MSKTSPTLKNISLFLAQGARFWLGLCCQSGHAEESKSLAPSIEEWSAISLAPGSFAFGSILESGLTEGVMIGADPAALALGVRTAHIKWQLPVEGEDAWSLGVKYSRFQRKSLFSESVRRHFDELEGVFLRPSIAWSNRISPRLTIHSMWASGIGRARATLSDEGKRELWKSKHGRDPFPGDPASSSEPSPRSETGNQQKSTENQDATFARRGMQLQSIAGLTEDRFQVTGDWDRDDGNRILLSTRFERTRLEELDTFAIRITIAQEWILDHFHLRIGGGPQYAIFSGRDLDGEDIKTAGWIPAGDLAVYWVY